MIDKMIVVTVITVILVNSNARTSDNNQICDTKIAEVDLCWFESYDRNFAIKIVANKLGISESDADLQITSIEEKLILIQNQESQDRIKSSRLESTSNLENLGPKYRRQIGPTNCGVASLAMAKDLLDDNIDFTSESEMFKISQTLDENVVKSRGMTLEEIYEASQELFSWDKTSVTKELPDSIEKLRQLLINHFKKKTPRILICNYSMKLAGQGNWRPGHISPIAAYDRASDSALILDVGRSSDPFWIDLKQLLSSTVLSVDSDSQKSRGFVQIERMKASDGLH